MKLFTLLSLVFGLYDLCRADLQTSKISLFFSRALIIVRINHIIQYHFLLFSRLSFFLLGICYQPNAEITNSNFNGKWYGKESSAKAACSEDEKCLGYWKRSGGHIGILYAGTRTYAEGKPNPTVKRVWKKSTECQQGKLYFNINDSSFKRLLCVFSPFNFFVFFEIDPRNCIWANWEPWSCPEDGCLGVVSKLVTRNRQKRVVERYDGYCNGSPSENELCRKHCPSNLLQFNFNSHSEVLDQTLNWILIKFHISLKILYI